MKIPTQLELRKLFWAQHPQFKRAVVPVRPLGHYRAKEQNDYPADIRVAWVDFVDHCARSGEISEALASRATLK